MSEQHKLPKREKLVESLSKFNNFRDSCKLQLDLGYPFRVEFPSKTNLNKILAIQYFETSMIEKIYGPTLSNDIFLAIPQVKLYLKFLQETEKTPNVASKK